MQEDKNNKDTIKDKIRKFKGFVQDVFEGRLLTKYNIPELFPSVLVGFILVWLYILIGYCVESTMSQVEQNKKILNELQIKKAQKTIELASFNRISRIEKLLEEKGSNVKMPKTPAIVIKK